jgi:hypothetical protein
MPYYYGVVFDGEGAVVIAGVGEPCEVTGDFKLSIFKTKV